jgi:opacity protein-like surface antigen
MEFKHRFKLSLICLAIASPTSLLAQPAASPCSFSGLTLGLGLGASTFMTDISNDTSAGTAALDPTKNIYDFGPMAAVFVGYGNVFDNHAYLAGELGLNVFAPTETSVSDTARSNVTMTSTDPFPPDISTATYTNSLYTKTKVTRNAVEPFLDLKAGYLVTPTALIYLRGGISYNNLKIKTNSVYNATGTTTVISSGGSPESVNSSVAAISSFYSSQTKSTFSWRLGIGTEYMVTPNFGIGADYIYTFYPNLKTTASSSANDVACDVLEGCVADTAAFANTSKASLNDQQVMAKLIYHFS